MRQFLLLTALIIVAVVGRLIPHPPNLTPLLAVGLMSGMLFKSRAVSFGVMFVATLSSDIVLNSFDQTVQSWNYNSYDQLTVYATLILLSVLGKYLQPRKFLHASGLALGGSLLFFLTTNFTCWLTGNMFPPTFSGMLQNYAFALPFLGNTLVGDQFWTLFLVGVYSYAPKQAQQPHLNWEMTPLAT